MFKGILLIKGEIFKPDISGIICLIDRFENLIIVELTDVELMSAGVSRRMKRANKIDIVGDLANHIPFGDLLMVDVKQHVDMRTADRADNFECVVEAGCVAMLRVSPKFAEKEII